ncbi:MAG: hypothetical protein H6585_02475 [Flavobacteriales bacterium]|nr:hypothetical protein [Flavobacteriales bacterium]MCB9447194.1 hypothetical protein [Flavobacteriales bacterium]
MQTLIRKTTGPHLVVWITVASIGALLFSGCSSTRYTRIQNDDDDVYYATTDVPVQQPAPERTYQEGNQPSPTENQAEKQNDAYYDSEYKSEPAQAAETETQTDAKGNTYVTNNYYGNNYDEDDYYDYAYTARIRRFYNHSGWSYYDPYYTNLYWYDRYPSSWGVSIYCGYRWWRPYSHTTVYISYGDPWYYGPGYYDPWYSPYYSWGSYRHGYRNGYWNGYWNGYYDGYYNGHGYYGNNNPNYYNSRDYTSHHYGPRGGITGSNGREIPKTLGERYETFKGPDRTPTPTLRDGRPDVKVGEKKTQFTDPNGNPAQPRPTNVNTIGEKPGRDTGLDGGTGVKPNPVNPRDNQPESPIKKTRDVNPGNDNTPTRSNPPVIERQPDVRPQTDTPSPGNDKPTRDQVPQNNKTKVIREQPETTPNRERSPNYQMDKPAPQKSQSTPSRINTPRQDRPSRQQSPAPQRSPQRQSGNNNQPSYSTPAPSPPSSPRPSGGGSRNGGERPTRTSPR